jgi:ribosomal protein S1
METNAVATPENTEIHDLSDVERKMRFTGTVMKTSLAGALVDIGVEIPGVVHISQLQEEPVNRVEDVVQVGQEVEVWVKRVIPKKKRLELTMLEPLDLEWREIKKEMVLKGKVVRLETFGAFIDIGAERPGLVHISEITHDYIVKPGDVIKEGEEVEVMVLNVNRQKKQIKLSMKTLEVPPAVEEA